MTKTTPEQINVLIAEKIGWTPEPCPGRFVTADYVGSGRQLFITCGAKYTYPGPMVHDPLPPPHYSTDMSAAWDALKHAVLGFPDHLADRSKLINALFLRTEEHDEINVYYTLGVMCAWTPENICKSILKAYGVEV